MRFVASLLLCLSGVLTLNAQVPTTSDVSPAKQGRLSGHIEERTLDSNIYGRARKVWIYTPVAYSAERQPAYAVLYCFDGDDYVHDMAATTQLDELIAERKIPAMVAVFIDTAENRLNDLANHQKFADFMAGELVPWAQKSLNITSDAKNTVIGGASAGGLAAAFVAFAHPELFGNVLSQSGGFWRGPEGRSTPYEWLTAQYASAPKKDVRFYLEVGAAETNRALGSGPVFIDANRRFRDALRAKGYSVEYIEVLGAKHEPAHWRTQFGPGLVFLTSTWAR